MTVKRGGLGRNLSALLSPSASAQFGSSVTNHGLDTKPVHSLSPGKYQPRREMHDDSLAELADSIRKQGLLQPLVVRETQPGFYEIIAGERRWRACQLAGITEVPVVIRQVDDETAMALALIENMQREDLNALDQARAMQRLIEEFGLTHQQIADILSKSRASVSNALRLLNLNEDVSRMLEHGDLDMGHARCLLMLEGVQQSQIATLVMARELSVRETEVLVARVKSGKQEKPKAPSHEVPLLVRHKLKALSGQLDTKVTLKHGPDGRGSLVIHYSDTDILDKIMAQFLSNTEDA